MAKKLITGNEAVALGALRAGVKVATGYPGTPSTGCLTHMLDLERAGELPGEGRHVEWSSNEKVAFEIAAGAAWAGHRALCTMKMSGLNVCYDSLAGVAYSGIVGGLVIYVADDPGANAGMVEQDSRGFALMSDLPMLEPATVADAYRLTQTAFEISEQTGAPVFVRTVTATANSYAVVEVEDPLPPLDREPVLIHDINKFTKAGAVIAMNQHRDTIARLAKAGEIIHEMGLNPLRLARNRGGLGVIVAGVAAAYLDEALALLADNATVDAHNISVLTVLSVHPFPTHEAAQLLAHCDTLLVLEELEPQLERSLYVEAQRAGFRGRIIGKLDGTLSRVGEYGVSQVVRGIAAALGIEVAAELLAGHASESLAAARPITVCAGCPHRGTYMAINQALRRLKYKQGQVMVTGDIGCTILGMNPPFNTVWNELSMGASIGLGMGFAVSGLKTPVIATIGDSTFFHAGLPALINAVQHQIPLTLIIMDNGWTAMTGMQVNAGTGCGFQGSGCRPVDIANIVPAMGVDQFFMMDPFDLPSASATLQEAVALPGVKVILSRQECAIQAIRHGGMLGTVEVVTDKCNQCKLCISITGCAAISLTDTAVAIDPGLCYGCGLCVETCNRDALIDHPLEVVKA